MKTALPIVAVVLALLAPAAASAQAPGHTFGLGIEGGGVPNFGFTGKYWVDSTDAFQGSIGWSGVYYEAPGPVFTFDWQRRVGRIQPRTHVVRFGFDVGVGGALGFVTSGCYTDLRGNLRCYNGNAALMLRVPLAFAAYFPRPRVEAFAEITPTLAFLPYFGPVLMGAVGGRFYF